MPLAAPSPLSLTLPSPLHGTSRAPVVAWSPDHATSSTEGLLLSKALETFGPSYVRGQETRAQQLVTSFDQNVDEVLLDLLAHSVLADSIALGSESVADPRLATSRRFSPSSDALRADGLWNEWR